MIYSELIDHENRGIYTVLFDRLKESNFDNLQNTYIKSGELDERFLYENGMKECNFNDLNSASNILIAKYFDKWSRIISILIVSQDLPDGASSKTTTKNGGNIETINKLSAYDSDEMISDNSSIQNDDTNSEVLKYDLSGRNFILTTFKNNYVYDIINSDIRKTLFRNVY